MKRMQVLCAALCLALTLTACGGGAAAVPAPETGSPQTQAPETVPPAPETAGAAPDGESAAPAQAAQAAGELLAATVELAGQDYEAFSALYRNTPEETIQQDFQHAFSLEQYDRTVCVPMLVTGRYALVDCVYYIVTGTHPNTRMHSEHFACQFSFADGQWKLDYSQEATEALNAALQRDAGVYPQSLLDAAEAGRNASVFSGNYMYLEPSAVYQGHSQCEVRFAWQEADGSVSLGLWLANGTEGNLCYGAMDLCLTDESLGEILDVRGMTLDIPVPAGTGTLQVINIPADQIQTGTAPWTTVSCDVTVSF